MHDCRKLIALIFYQFLNTVLRAWYTRSKQQRTFKCVSAHSTNNCDIQKIVGWKLRNNLYKSRCAASSLAGHVSKCQHCKWQLQLHLCLLAISIFIIYIYFLTYSSSFYWLLFSLMSEVMNLLKKASTLRDS